MRLTILDCAARVRAAWDRAAAGLTFGLAAALLLMPCPGMAQVKVAPGQITTIAGDYSLNPGLVYAGDGGPALQAQLAIPFHAVFVGGNLYIADQFNEVIRLVPGGSGNISTVAGNNTNGFSKDGILAIDSDLASPSGVFVDGSGNIYIADTNNNAIRLVTKSTGLISTLAGDEQAGYGGDGSGALSANLLKPSSLAFDSAGNMYIADSGNNVIRVVNKASGNIFTYAGDFNTPGYTGDGKPATNVGVGLNDPVAIAMDAAGNLYIADTDNSAIRKVTAQTGIITTIAGMGPSAEGYSGDGGQATLAKLNHPKGVAVDTAGNVYISDTFNHVIRRVTPNGIISTVVGTGQPTSYTVSVPTLGDGPALQATLFYPAGLSIDSSGYLYIADTDNNVIRQYAPVSTATGTLPAINSGGVIGASSFGALPAISPGGWIEIYGTNLASTTGNWNNFFTGSPAVNAPTSLYGTTVTIGGLPAYIDYVSPTQVNAQVPAGVNGPTQVVVATAAGQSAAYSITANGTEAGLLAPANFKVGSTQYVAAVFPDFATYVAPTGAISGVTSRPAHVGDTIIMYGVGFGPVTPSPTPDPFQPGQIVPATPQNSITNPLAIFFGPAQATLTYSGLAPGFVGLYQFNAVVPAVAASNAVPVTFVLGNTNSTQSIYTAVQ